MKLAAPIDIDLKAFVLQGRWDYLELGQDRAWVLANFPDPDGPPPGPTQRLWQYGNTELHFSAEGILCGIYTDAIGRVSGGAALRIAPWRVNDGLALGQWMQLLADEAAAFRAEYRPRLREVDLTVEASGVRLGFSVGDGAVTAAPLRALSMRAAR